MGFKDLSPASVKCLWDRWKYSIERVLSDFNEDVFGGSGCIQENSYFERPYLCLQTKKYYLYIFPIQGNRLVVGAFREMIKKEYLSMKPTAQTLDRENLIGWFALDLDIAEQRYETLREKYSFLEEALRLLYKTHWSNLSF